jgi:hypothetical protein
LRKNGVSDEFFKWKATLSMKMFDGRFEQTCSLASVIASSATQQSNTPTPFAKKWTDDESNLRRLIGIDN